MSVAICIGHSRRIDGRREGGAESCAPVSTEWAFNDALGRKIVELLHDRHEIPAILINDYEGDGYGAAMRWLAARLRAEGDIKLAVELHFNSDDDPDANGHEFLHWHTSQKGKLVAAILAMEMTLSHLPIRSRGVKPIKSGGRGDQFLRLTHCPAVICEPFFGSNARNWETARANPEIIAAAIAKAIATALQRL